MKPRRAGAGGRRPGQSAASGRRRRPASGPAKGRGLGGSPVPVTGARQGAFRPWCPLPGSLGGRASRLAKPRQVSGGPEGSRPLLLDAPLSPWAVGQPALVRTGRLGWVTCKNPPRQEVSASHPLRTLSLHGSVPNSSLIFWSLCVYYFPLNPGVVL